MKKIKITEKQAKLLETLNSKKVLKVTKEQYNRIIESELYRPSLTETPELHEEGINEELFREFINELYGMNEEGAECKYDKLNKVMEAAGLIEGGKLVKEKFGKDPKKVKEVVGKGLMKLKECGSVYEAVELMEALTDAEKAKIKSGDDIMNAELKANVDKFLEKNPDQHTIRLSAEKGDYKGAHKMMRNVQTSLEEEMELDEREHLGANQIKLNDLTFEKVKEFFPNFYQKPKESHGTKDMSDDYYSYFDSISFPNPDDSSTAIENRGVFEYWKNKTLDKYGEDVTLEFNPDEVWSRRVTIINNPSFDNDKKRYDDVKKSHLSGWREKGNFGLDETSLGGGAASGGVGDISYDTPFGSEKPAFKSNVESELTSKIYEALKKK